MIYLFSEYERITPEIEQMLIDKLPPKRRERTLRFKHRGGRLSCLLGYLLFLYGFRNIYKESALPDFDVTSSGKPYLKDYPDIHFNISHCNGAVACIFSDMAVGLDIQEMREMSDSILNKVCSNEEIEQIHQENRPDRPNGPHGSFQTGRFGPDFFPGGCRSGHRGAYHIRLKYRVRQPQFRRA